MDRRVLLGAAVGVASVLLHSRSGRRRSREPTTCCGGTGNVGAQGRRGCRTRRGEGHAGQVTRSNHVVKPSTTDVVRDAMGGSDGNGCTARADVPSMDGNPRMPGECVWTALCTTRTTGGSLSGPPAS